MSSDSFEPGDQQVIDRLRSSQEFSIDIHPQTELRIRRAVFERIDEGARVADWFFRPLWRPILAALLPFATGLAFGQSDYLNEPLLRLEPAQSIDLVTSIDAADGLLEYFAAHVEAEDVE